MSMAFTPIQQFEQLLSQSKHILIVFSPATALDPLASALAAKAWLEKKGKQVDVSATDFTLPKNAKFLSGSTTIKPELQELQKFIIKIDVSKAPLETLSYDVNDGTLSIYLTPRHGILSKNELRTAQSTFKYDLIITLNTADLESLGKIYSDNTELFFRTPIVNIDYHASNEHYGQVNLIDVTATAVAEIMAHTLRQLDEAACDTSVSTALLTGMVAATRSFKTANVTPQALQLASHLIKLGAERETVIHHLYRMHSLTTLKLWGQALSRLQYDKNLGLVWTSLTREDFTRSGGSTEDVKGIIDELISNSPEAKITLFLYEIEGPAGNQVHAIFGSEKQANAVDLVKTFNPQGDKKQATFMIPGKTLKEVEEEILKKIKEELEKSIS
jgi:bifunctional oligoribonuclease and PAP phosphatase NrnA